LTDPTPAIDTNLFLLQLLNTNLLPL